MEETVREKIAGSISVIMIASNITPQYRGFSHSLFHSCDVSEAREQCHWLPWKPILKALPESRALARLREESCSQEHTPLVLAFSHDAGLKTWLLSGCCLCVTLDPALPGELHCRTQHGNWLCWEEGREGKRERGDTTTLLSWISEMTSHHQASHCV